MEPINTTDAVMGWALIVAAALIFYFGTTFLVGFLIRSIGAALEQHRSERERLQDDLDDLARLELRAMVTNEDADGGERRASRDEP